MAAKKRRNEGPERRKKVRRGYRELSRESERWTWGNSPSQWPRWDDLGNRWFWLLIGALLVANIVFRLFGGES